MRSDLRAELQVLAATAPPPARSRRVGDRRVADKGAAGAGLSAKDGPAELSEVATNAGRLVSEAEAKPLDVSGKEGQRALFLGTDGQALASSGGRVRRAVAAAHSLRLLHQLLPADGVHWAAWQRAHKLAPQCRVGRVTDAVTGGAGTAGERDLVAFLGAPPRLDSAGLVLQEQGAVRPE